MSRHKSNKFKKLTERPNPRWLFLALHRIIFSNLQEHTLQDQSCVQPTKENAFTQVYVDVTTHSGPNYFMHSRLEAVDQTTTKNTSRYFLAL